VARFLLAHSVYYLYENRVLAFLAKCHKLRCYGNQGRPCWTL